MRNFIKEIKAHNEALKGSKWFERSLWFSTTFLITAGSAIVFLFSTTSSADVKPVPVQSTPEQVFVDHVRYAGTDVPMDKLLEFAHNACNDIKATQEGQTVDTSWVTNWAAPLLHGGYTLVDADTMLRYAKEDVCPSN